MSRSNGARRLTPYSSGRDFPSLCSTRFIALNSETRGLTKIRPGEIFDFQTDSNGEFLQMRYALDEARYLFVRQEETGLRQKSSSVKSFLK